MISHQIMYRALKNCCEVASKNRIQTEADFEYYLRKNLESSYPTTLFSHVRIPWPKTVSKRKNKDEDVIVDLASQRKDGASEFVIELKMKNKVSVGKDFRKYLERQVNVPVWLISICNERAKMAQISRIKEISRRLKRNMHIIYCSREWKGRDYKNYLAKNWKNNTKITKIVAKGWQIIEIDKRSIQLFRNN